MEAAGTFANRKAQTVPNNLARGIVGQLDLRDNPTTCQQWR
jgi:hypothetical protein